MVDMPLRPAFLQFACALTLAWLWPKVDDAGERSAPPRPLPLALTLAMLLSLGTAMHWTFCVSPRGLDDRDTYSAALRTP